MVQKRISMLNFECLKFLTHKTWVIRHMAWLGSLYTVQGDLKLTAESLWRILSLSQYFMPYFIALLCSSSSPVYNIHSPVSPTCLISPI